MFQAVLLAVLPRLIGIAPSEFSDVLVDILEALLGLLQLVLEAPHHHRHLRSGWNELRLPSSGLLLPK